MNENEIQEATTDAQGISKPKESLSERDFLERHYQSDKIKCLNDFRLRVCGRLKRAESLGHFIPEKMESILKYLSNLVTSCAHELSVLDSQLVLSRETQDDDLWKYCRIDPPTPADIRHMRERINKFNREECGVDVDHDPYIQVIVIDTSEEEVIPFHPMPILNRNQYRDDQAAEYQDQLRIVRTASINAWIANERLNRELGWLLSLERENSERTAAQKNSDRVNNESKIA